MVFRRLRSHLQIYQRTISAYININFKKSIKVDATSAMYNISDEKWIVYCRYCDKKGHMMQSCNTLKQDKEKNQVNNEWINKSKAERKCD